jgi:hypothetical protein
MVMGSRSLVDRESCKPVLPDRNNLNSKLKVVFRFSPQKIQLDIVFDLDRIH